MTTINPRANSKIERFHRTLKVALRAGLPGNWKYRLPMAINCAPTNIVFDTSLRIPADILTKSSNDEIEPNVNAAELRKAMSQLLLPKDTFAPIPGQIDIKLLSCDYVFVKNNTKKGLDSHYIGPFNFLERYEECFKLQLNIKIDTIAMTD